MKAGGRTQPRVPYAQEFRNRKGLQQTIRDTGQRLRRVELRDIPSDVGQAFLLAVQNDGTPVGEEQILNFVAGSNITLTITDNGQIISVQIDATGSGLGGYDTVEDEGTPLTQRSTIDFVGAGVSAADSGGKTVVTIPGASGGDGTFHLGADGCAIHWAGADEGDTVRFDLNFPEEDTAFAFGDTVLTASELSVILEIGDILDGVDPASARVQSIDGPCSPLLFIRHTGQGVIYIAGDPDAGNICTTDGIDIIMDGLDVGCREVMLVYNEDEGLYRAHITDGSISPFRRNDTAITSGIISLGNFESGHRNWIIAAAESGTSDTCVGIIGGQYVGYGGQLLLVTVNYGDTILFKNNDVGVESQDGTRLFLGGSDISVAATSGPEVVLVFLYAQEADGGNGGWVLVGGSGGSGGTTIATDPIWVALGDTDYATGPAAAAVLSGNITTTRKFYSQTGDGVNSAAPAWNQPAFTDITGTITDTQHGVRTLANAHAHSALSGIGPNDHHNRLHAMTGTSDHSAGTWKVFYSDGSGNVQELALAASGVLTANGVSAAPSFSAVPTQTSTLLDGTIHTDTLAGTVVRGDVIVGNSTPKWAKVTGVANAVLQFSTDTTWVTNPRLSDISDTSGNTRITNAAATPHVTLAGDVKVTTHLGVLVAPSSTIGISFSETVTDATNRDGASILVTASSTASGTTYRGVFGQSTINSGSTASFTLIRGLDFQAVNNATGATITDMQGLYAQAVGSASATHTNLYGALIEASTFPQTTHGVAVYGRAKPRSGGTVTVNNASVFAADCTIGGASLAVTVTNLYYYRTVDFTKVTTHGIATNLFGFYSAAYAVDAQHVNVYPFYDAGFSRTDNTVANVFRSNTQFGSTTVAMGGGDGIVSIANATTNPTTTPTNAALLWANTSVLNIGFAGMQVNQATLGNAVETLVSTATNDDPTEIVYQNRAATTDATVTTLHTFTIPASTTYAIRAFVTARRTGGAAGTAEDAAHYEIAATIKNVAGVATLVTAGATANPIKLVEHEDVAGYQATIDVTGATARVRVTGVANTNITWHVTARVWLVGS